MKILSALFLLITFEATVNAQVISYDDFKSVIPLIQKEDFKGAFEKTTALLNATQNDSSDLRAIVTYMNIYSSAGMVSLKQLSHENFKKNAQKYIGQRIVMSAHPCVDSSSMAFNSLKFTIQNNKYQGSIASTNESKTSIFCFEYFDYDQEINPTDFIGKNVRCGGILNSVEINPNKSSVWISRIRITNAFARIMSPQ